MEFPKGLGVSIHDAMVIHVDNHLLPAYDLLTKPLLRGQHEFLANGIGLFSFPVLIGLCLLFSDVLTLSEGVCLAVPLFRSVICARRLWSIHFQVP